jgi:hypothetical protein
MNFGSRWGADGRMLDFPQFVAGRSGELGVQGQYLDGELHFVDDTLSGAVTTVEKFEILNSVVGSDTVDMMDGFFWHKVASKLFGHDVAVFHNVFSTGSSKNRNRDPHVTVSLFMSAIFAALKAFECLSRLGHNFAIMVAVFLLFVQTSSRFAAFRIFFAARQAYESVSSFAGFAPSYTRTLTRAVPRITCIFLVVRINEGFHHGKFFAAFAASKFHDGLSHGQWLIEAVRTSAQETAVLPVFTRKTGKRSLAVFTNFLNRHWLVPSFGDEGTLLMSIGIVK